MITFIGFITEAMDKYTEALAASDFSKETGNVNTLVIPILCNLAACCIQTGRLIIHLCVNSFLISFSTFLCNSH
jgi:hypothetical protein